MRNMSLPPLKPPKPANEYETTPGGGRQSRITGDITEVPPLALIEVSRVMEQGQKRYPREPDGTPNWHKINCRANLKHALEHAANFCAELNRPQDHRREDYLLEEISHATARMMMALEQLKRGYIDDLPREQNGQTQNENQKDQGHILQRC